MENSTVTIHRHLHEQRYIYSCVVCLFMKYVAAHVDALLVGIILVRDFSSVFYFFIQIFNIHTYVAIEFGTLTTIITMS